MSSEVKMIGGIKLYRDRPTALSFDELYTWVIWQFPRRLERGYCGAVRPPVADHSWLPAVIEVEKQHVQVYGHVNEEYTSPEMAIEFFASKES